MRRNGRGEGRETPMAAPARSNKALNCDAWAEVCFSESVAHVRAVDGAAWPSTKSSL